MGYQTIGLLAIGKRALGFSSGLAVKVGKLDPGPHRIRACRPGAAIETACGIFASYFQNNISWVLWKEIIQLSSLWPILTHSSSDMNSERTYSWSVHHNPCT